MHDTNAGSRLPRAVLVDVDGTLAHADGRDIMDFSQVGLDRVDETIAEIVRIFAAAGLTVVVMSGRKETCRRQTEVWLAVADVPSDALLMRDRYDDRPDVQVKRDLYDRHVRGRYDVLCVLDDRSSVVQGWRDLGLTCLQVAPGDF